MGTYITWDKARQFLDAESLGDSDILMMQKLVQEAEQRFDARLRRRFDLPFTEAGDPNSYAIAQNVCAMWAAASYIRNRRQAEGTEDQTWYATQLDNMAEQQLAFLETRRAPADAEPADDPLVYTPYDGEPDHTALFNRDNITSGDTHW